MELPLQEILLRLVAATLLTGIIGIEREVRQKPAGVRTNALIGLGAATMTLCGIVIATQWPGASDPSRIASVIVQGVGFICAGVIIQASGSVHGLTTAATMWVVAGIGIAAGFGLYEIAAITAGLVLVMLAIFGPLDAKFLGDERSQAQRGWPFGKKTKNDE
jgi:putative Mg2+ transporter-C (MgtC) family protein